MDRPQGLASLCPPLLSEDLPTIPGPHPVSGKQPRPLAPWWFSAAGVEARPQEPGLAWPARQWSLWGKKRLKLWKAPGQRWLLGAGYSSCSSSPSGLAPTTGAQGKAVPLATVQDGLAQIWETAHPPGFSVSRRKGVHGRIPTSSPLSKAVWLCGLQTLKGSSPKASLACLTASHPLTDFLEPLPSSPAPDAARSSSVSSSPSAVRSDFCSAV